MKTYTRFIQLMVDDETYQLLRLMSYHKAVSMSQLIREAIRKTYSKEGVS